MKVHGTITKTKPDGTTTDCEYLIDSDKGEVVQLGGEVDIVAEDIDLIIAMLTLGAQIDQEGDTDADHQP